MNRIYKYTLSPDNEIIEIPSNSILSCESQEDNIVVYAIINTEDTENRKFEFKVIGTGIDIDVDISQYNFLDTVKMNNDKFVFHVFYRPYMD